MRMCGDNPFLFFDRLANLLKSFGVCATQFSLTANFLMKNPLALKVQRGFHFLILYWLLVNFSEGNYEGIQHQ